MAGPHRVGVPSVLDTIVGERHAAGFGRGCPGEVDLGPYARRCHRGRGNSRQSQHDDGDRFGRGRRAPEAVLRRDPEGVGDAVGQPGDGRRGRRTDPIGKRRPGRGPGGTDLDDVVDDRQAAVGGRGVPGQACLLVPADGDDAESHRRYGHRHDRVAGVRRRADAGCIHSRHPEEIARAVGKPGDGGRRGTRGHPREPGPGDRGAVDLVLDDVVADRTAAVAARGSPGERHAGVARGGRDDRRGTRNRHRRDPRRLLRRPEADRIDRRHAEDVGRAVGKAGDDDRRRRRRGMRDGRPRRPGSSFTVLDAVIRDRPAAIGGRSRPGERHLRVAERADEVQRSGGCRHRHKRPGDVAQRAVPGGIHRSDTELVRRPVGEPVDVDRTGRRRSVGEGRPRGRRCQSVFDQYIGNRRAAVVGRCGPGEGHTRVAADTGQGRRGRRHRHRHHRARRRRPGPQAIGGDRCDAVGVGRPVDEAGHGRGGCRRHRISHDRPAHAPVEARLDLVIGDRRATVTGRDRPAQIDLTVASHREEGERCRRRGHRRDRPGHRREGRVADGIGRGDLELIRRAVAEPGHLDARAGDRRQR